MSREVVLHVAKVSGISGSENHLLLLLPDLRTRGWDVRCVVLHEGEAGARAFAQRLEEGGVPVEVIRLPFPGDPRAAAALLRSIRRNAPAIVHTHLVHADFHALPLARLARVPVRASTKHGFNPFRESRAFGLADRTVGRLADLQIAISHGLARYLADREGFDPQAFEVVHYGIVAGPEPPPVPRVPRLAIVGRLIPIKGHDVLLDALARLGDRGVELDIAGDGSLRTSLEARVEELGLGGRVRFLGHVAPAGPVLEAASIVVVPSHGEGFGMVALEAQERGRAVVASAVGGLPEILVDGETGLIVPPDDPGALAAALEELLADPDRVAALGAAGRRRALEAFSQERCTARTQELYRAALSRAGA